MKKTLLALILTLAMLVSLAGCETSDSSTPPASDNETASGEEGAAPAGGEGEQPTGEQPLTKEEKYADALAKLESGSYAEAYLLFSQLGDFEDSAKHLAQFYFIPTSVEHLTWGDTYTLTVGANGLPSKVSFMTDTGDKISDAEYTYNASGDILTEVITYADGDVYSTEYTYDAEGNRTRWLRNSNGDVLDVEYTYDEHNRLIREYHTTNGVWDYTMEQTYDTAGNCLTRVRTDVSGTWSITYTYIPLFSPSTIF